MMKYKDYIAKVDYDDAIELFHGEVINIRDVITFQGASVKELKKEFKASVEDYLNFCNERGEAPDRAFSGKFNLRVNPGKHRDIYISATKKGMSINDFVNESIDKSLYGRVKCEDKNNLEYETKRRGAVKKKNK